MRELSLEELELIAGTYDTTARVPVPGHYPSYTPSTYYPPSIGGGSPPAPAPPCQPAEAPADRVDRNVLKNPIHEGLSNPANHPTDNSGLTIGYGTDLKSKSTTWLSSSGISTGLYNQLAPYVGKYGSDVDNMLAAGAPITASTTDINLLFDKAYNDSYSQATQLYNSAQAANGLNLPFSQLPAPLQTVIMDIGYQTPQITNDPRFFSAVTQGRWEDAATELENWYGPGQSTPRYTDDANIIRNAIGNGTVPQSTSGACK